MPFRTQHFVPHANSVRRSFGVITSQRINVPHFERHKGSRDLFGTARYVIRLMALAMAANELEKMLVMIAYVSI